MTGKGDRMGGRWRVLYGEGCESARVVNGLDLNHHVQSSNGFGLLDRGFPRVYLLTSYFIMPFCRHVT
jgi:hypothetical protein